MDRRLMPGVDEPGSVGLELAETTVRGSV